MKVLFLGSASFAIPTLDAIAKKHEVPLVVTQPPRTAGRNRKARPTPIAEFARSLNLEVLESENVNSSEAIDLIRDLGADVAIVVAFGQLLRKKILSTVERGFFNLHGSVLPNYRGAAPIQRSLMDGVDESGVSIFRIDQGMDTGDIALIKKLPVDPIDTFDTLSEKLAETGAGLVLDFLEDPDIALNPQEGTSSYASKIKVEDTFVDWSDSADKVGNVIRAFDSSPGAKTTFYGDRVKLFGFRGVEKNVKAAPGKIVDLGSDALVACGDGAVRIGKIQFPSKKVITFAEARNGRKIDVDLLFGT